MNCHSSWKIKTDDNSPTTSCKYPKILEKCIQQDGNEIVNWFDKNDINCSAEKTKLLIVGTRANRKSKLDKRNQKIKITISEKEIEETTSEKLLGVVVNNTLTWKQHIHGDSENLGLLKNLSNRIGILKKLRKCIPDNKFKQN